MTFRRPTIEWAAVRQNVDKLWTRTSEQRTRSSVALQGRCFYEAGARRASLACRAAACCQKSQKRCGVVTLLWSEGCLIWRTISTVNKETSPCHALCSLVINWGVLAFADSKNVKMAGTIPLTTSRWWWQGTYNLKNQLSKASFNSWWVSMAVFFFFLLVKGIKLILHFF